MIPTHPFGSTGHISTRIIFGSAVFSSARQIDADQTMALVIDAGISRIDTAASERESELRLRPWIE
jgi:aryl-alcohol dehydrogenase-like predicted oxidoreductase